MDSLKRLATAVFWGFFAGLGLWNTLTFCDHFAYSQTIIEVPIKGTGNVVIGKRAGPNLARGDGNLIIGANACPDIIDGSFNVCLGANTKAGADVSRMLILPGKTVPLSDMSDDDIRELQNVLKTMVLQ